MKMSEVFELPISSKHITAPVTSKLKSGVEWVDGDKAAAHAINCHDELVEALEATKLMILSMKKEHGGLITEDIRVQRKVDKALAKARGEA